MTRIVRLISGGQTGADRAALMSARCTGFGQRLIEREWLACPAVQLEDDGRLLYQAEGGRRVHHGAAFSVTRWTNIYDPHALAFGDLISGSLEGNFHVGIEEHAVRMRRRFLGIPGTRVFTHTHYWSMDADGKADGGAPSGPAGKDHVALLRQAVALADAPKQPQGIVV